MMFARFIVVLVLSLGCIRNADAGLLPNIPFNMSEIKAPSFPKRSFDIRKYSAVGDGKTLNTKAFADAVAACSKAGGGRVLVPAGTWLTGPIHLKSNINLYLEKGAQLVFSANFNDYLPPVFTRWQGMECYNYSPMIYARDCTNIAITGEGTIGGQGEAWWRYGKQKRAAAGKLYAAICAGVPVKDRVLGTEEYLSLRPSLIQPINCKNVLIEGVTVKNGPMWTVHPVYCENVLVRNITVNTEGPNTDGFVPDSCKNVIIEDSVFSTGDDCIVIKSGLDEDAWRVNRPSENIVIRRCRTQRGHGGVVVGSEMSGGVRNVFISDCRFDGTQRGIRMKSRRGRGGVVENIWVKNVTMGEIMHDAITVSMLYGAGAVPPRTSVPPTFRGIHISNVKCEKAGRAVEFVGLPDKPIENITLEGICVGADVGVYCTDVRDVKLTNLQVSAKQGPVVQLVNSRDVTISGSNCPEGTDVFLKVQGGKTSGIHLAGNDLSKAKTDVVAGEDVPAGAVDKR
ncbi:MAG TPA: glycoside hydrolase family 28 protein [Armatimonadota bacterium]|nr:glycoside hydrolase family 28 protein [Armatimonadota bacterium]